ncbi:nickel pincer cofactor biosynthesis protein LarB [Treponema sp.]|uniref:nickel pincer cofactor biosynthesis protein LarB n=1 Tax=Treponema sp. TaxID=166 RepID=UPI0025F114F9|nr:nickel pincer cofactor biosynthesis protein LarB [Treponema sp.]MCR5218631.1 nickel pincer cofactor biosynthesis protein LarB [Treponema sp.]
MKDYIPLSSDNKDFARLDSSRKERTGFNEVVFCQGKTIEETEKIFARLYKENHTVMGTRASEEQYLAVKKNFPQCKWDKESRILIIQDKEEKKEGLIAVCTAGTADIRVAEEAAQTAEYFGCNTERFYDIGVSGIHRLLDVKDQICRANAVIAVAGMEGALASVLGGLVKVPVIAVPVSTGYGAAFEGLSALLTMINSCANGISVVNIDNGYGAAYIATQINRLAVRGKK